jgi:glycosyltransferase involved in cell wall biosynthesis
MQKLSVAIITLNEEANIGDAIDSVSFADEVVVVDSLSTDRTCEIASARGAVVVEQEFLGHVEQKSLAIDHTTCSWVLSIDADERVTPELADKIKQVLAEGDHAADAYEVNRRVFYLGRWIRHSGWYPDRRIRLFRRDRAHWQGTNPHDWLVCRDGKTARLDADLLHYSYRDMAHHLQTMNFFTDISSRELFKKNRSSGLFQMLFHPTFSFFKKLVLKQGWRDGMPGFIIAVGTAYYVFLKYAKLWELNHTGEARK